MPRRVAESITSVRSGTLTRTPQKSLSSCPQMGGSEPVRLTNDKGAESIPRCGFNLPPAEREKTSAATSPVLVYLAAGSSAPVNRDGKIGEELSRQCCRVGIKSQPEPTPDMCPPSTKKRNPDGLSIRLPIFAAPKGETKWHPVFLLGFAQFSAAQLCSSLSDVSR